MNRLTAKNPLTALRADCWRFPRPVVYSMAHSKPDTTMLTPNSAHPKREKKSTTACTQGRSNSSTPMLPIWAKKLPKKPMICPYTQSSRSSITLPMTNSQIKIGHHPLQQKPLWFPHIPTMPQI